MTFILHGIINKSSNIKAMYKQREPYLDFTGKKVNAILLWDLDFIEYIYIFYWIYWKLIFKH